MIQNQACINSESDDFHPSSSQSNNQYENHDENSSSISNDNVSNSEKSVSDGSADSAASFKQLSEREQLEREILKQVISKEKKITPFQEELTEQIFEKLAGFHDAAKDKQGEDLVTLRIQEMVLTKLLVMSYGRCEYRLVIAHFHLGEAYLRHQCIDQAIEHISLALHKNEKLFNEFSKTRLLHSYMQNVLAECLMQKEEYDDAIEMLKKSIQIQSKIKLQEQFNSKTRILLAKCHCHQKEYDEAIKIIDNILEIIKENGRGNEQYAFALVEKAFILATKDDYNSAVIAQEEAINTLIKINYPKPENVAEMYEKLAEYFEKLGNPQSTLACIQKVKTLYQQLYSAEDKRVIKARRKIATSLLKSQRFKEAVNELLQIVELEEKVFGESSIQTGRTLKLLGTVYISLEIGDARTYLKRGLKIFQSHGNKKQVQEIKEKLKLLMQSNGGNNEVKILSEQDL